MADSRTTTGPGPETIVREVRRALPSALGDLVAARSSALERGMRWPSWCWVPMAATTSLVVGAGLPGELIAPVHAVALWRLTREVVEVPHPDAVAAAIARVRGSVVDTPDQWLRTPTPSIDELSRLPVWCPYVCLPAGGWARGMFVHLEHDANTGRPELRFVVDTDGTLAAALSLVLYLDRPTLGRAAADFLAVARASADGAVGVDVAGIGGPESSVLGAYVFGVLPVVLALLDERFELRTSDDPNRTATPADGYTGLRAAPATTTWTQVPATSPRPRPALRLVTDPDNKHRTS